MKLVLYFVVKDETLTKRLLERAKTSGRADNNLETTKKHLETFHKQTRAVVHQYGKDRLVKISGEDTIDVIFAKVAEQLDKIIAKK